MGLEERRHQLGKFVRCCWNRGGWSLVAVRGNKRNGKKVHVLVGAKGRC